jgi:hypothetical protein
MALQQAIPYTQMNITELVAVHNALAADRGVDPIASRWHGGLCALVQKVAILRTQRPVPKPITSKRARAAARRAKKRAAPLRDFILKELAKVHHYEDATGKPYGPRMQRPAGCVSVGFPYAMIAQRVAAKFPTCRAVSTMIEQTAHFARTGAEGFECRLPDKRPRGRKQRQKGRTNGRR